ncbi:ATP-binding protein [Myxococcus sp. NMCA1]|uniref:ATP-binding protein n=1 Tax=Myxococcus sp. NMCA1 TaxID=2996785 RepID=UPI002286BB22|nr:ATP-binding protein [Myxococcus sp. NMCA1]WAM23131.1 ATP-binding protein [Myxococcus sp. NMCA1]
MRDIEFKTEGLNIITGPSSRGKSSILDIVDYCLMSERCPISKGFIRENVSHVGVLLVRGDESIVVVRALPDEGRLTSAEVHISKGTDKTLPQSPPEARWNIEAAKELLSDFTGIESLPVLMNEYDAAPEARSPANIRHCSFYVFQPQDVIASRNVAFAGLEDFYKKRHAADAAYYFQGILTIDRLRKRRELRSLTLLRQGPEGWTGRPGRRREVRWWWLVRWQVGQRGNQLAITRAIASRAVMKLSRKWRSGRE